MAELDYAEFHSKRTIEIAFERYGHEFYSLPYVLRNKIEDMVIAEFRNISKYKADGHPPRRSPLIKDDYPVES